MHPGTLGVLPTLLLSYLPASPSPLRCKIFRARPPARPGKTKTVLLQPRPSSLEAESNAGSSLAPCPLGGTGQKQHVPRFAIQHQHLVPGRPPWLAQARRNRGFGDAPAPSKFFRQYVALTDGEPSGLRAGTSRLRLRRPTDFAISRPRRGPQQQQQLALHIHNANGRSKCGQKSRRR